MLRRESENKADCRFLGCSQTTPTPSLKALDVSSQRNLKQADRIFDVHFIRNEFSLSDEIRLDGIDFISCKSKYLNNVKIRKDEKLECSILQFSY